MAETGGTLATIVNAVKSMTLTNVLVILLLVMGLAPAYLAWRILDDEALRDIVFSSFRVIPVSGSDCELREASEIGDEATWFLTHNFAFNGHDRWYVGINIAKKPDQPSVDEYCKVLSDLIIYSRDRTIQKPKFPHGGPVITVEP